MRMFQNYSKIFSIFTKSDPLKQHCLRRYSTILENTINVDKECKTKDISIFKKWAPEDSLQYFRQTRKWFPKASFSNDSARPFRVMTYNVLAECYKEEQDYGDTSDEILSWEFRHKLIIKELDQQRYLEDVKIDHNDPSDTSPDIICFQELYDEKLTNYLTNDASKKYEYISRKKGADKLDSIAIFWDTDLFEHIDNWAIYFNSGKECKIYNKAQVAQFVALKPKNPSYFTVTTTPSPKSQILLIANTHLIFNNSRGDIKLSQIDLVLKSLSYLKSHLQALHEDCCINFLLCGDLNCIPNSGIYTYISTGSYDCLTMKKNEMSGQKFAFKRKTYKHKYTQKDCELEEQIEEKHQKFIRGVRKLRKIKENVGNKTPYWVRKIQSAKIEGIGKEGILEFSVEEDTPELMEKCDELDIALKKFHEAAITDKNDKKKRSKMSKDDMNLLMQEMPDLILRSPVGPLISSYAKVMQDFLDLITGFVDGADSNTKLEQILGGTENVHALLKSELFRSRIFNGGMVPPMISDESNLLGIDTKEFVNYWKNLTKEQSYSYFTEMHGMLDYIWYSGEGIEAVRTLNVPNFYKELPFEMSPNEVTPSDHFPMMAEFILK
ncbi:unnamed protein product [Moneuplotes crassus]|uniref:Endonuclease/exonuclease/phosphatase domain-containing protein n=1 Tax=Euplotes crassus TaxID=5936 RepID=A0AAD1X7G6_EUPCR|nr:unnamed protein product [Moneuplotes crassus]